MKKYLCMLLITFYVLSCQNSPDNKNTEAEEAGHDHEQEEPKILLTSYSPDLELFAEADPFITGKESNVLSHFTQLSNFKPIETPNVTLRLEVGGKQVSQTLNEPTRTGIYSFSVTPSVAGSGRLIYEIKTVENSYEIVVENVRVFDNEEEADEAAHAAEPSQTNATVFTKEQSWKIDFATELPTTEPFGQVIKTTALVQSTPADEMQITAKTGGIVFFATNNLTEGKETKTGEKLFTISGNSFADNNSTVRYTEAKNNFEKAASDFERAKELATEKIVSEKELLAAKNEYENTKAVFENLDKNFSANGQTVISPMSGFLKHIFVQNGAFVEVGQPVAILSQNKKLMLSAEIQPKYATLLSNFQTANIVLPENGSSLSLEELNGKMLSYGKAASHDNYLVPVNLEIANNGSFIPGSFVTVFLKTVNNRQALTIPNTALLEEQGNFFVFVQITPELFEKREIETGETDGNKTIVTGGISAGERVVTQGAMFIKLSQASGALDPHAGHVH